MQSIIDNILADGHYPATMKEYSKRLAYSSTDSTYGGKPLDQITEEEWVQTLVSNKITSSTIKDSSKYTSDNNIICPTSQLQIVQYVPKTATNTEPFYIRISSEVDKYSDEIKITTYSKDNGSNFDADTSRPYVVYYSGTKPVTINLNNGTFYGIVYAPNASEVTITGSKKGNVYNGVLLAGDNIDINDTVATYDVTYNNSYNDFGLDTSGS